MIDWDLIRKANPDLEFKNNDIYIYKNEELGYSSFFAGCIQIEVRPIGKGAVVQIQFDNKSKSMELVKNSNHSVPITLCSESNFFNLSWKWKLIVIIFHSLDIIFFTFLILNIFFLFSTIHKVQNGKAAGLEISLARKTIIFFIVISLTFHIQFFIQIITDNNPNIPKPIFYSSGYKMEGLFLDSRHPKSVIDYVLFLILEKNPEIKEIYIPESVRSLCNVDEEKLDQWIPVGVTVLKKKPETVQEIQDNGNWQQYTIENNYDT
ncbi:MAG TPA: hypothetical protein ENL20_09840, partial [Candidatus Cloacimonetes bacterium]|nr:hypothetical protein [Candidatus Cloacimonadota bacterium]